MTVIKTIKLMVHKVDHIVLSVMGESKGYYKKLVVPNEFTAIELRRSFIRDYVKVQPSLLQVILLSLYVKLRHLIGTVTKRAVRKSRGIS